MCLLLLSDERLLHPNLQHQIEFSRVEVIYHEKVSLNEKCYTEQIPKYFLFTGGMNLAIYYSIFISDHCYFDITSHTIDNNITNY